MVCVVERDTVLAVLKEVDVRQGLEVKETVGFTSVLEWLEVEGTVDDWYSSLGCDGSILGMNVVFVPAWNGGSSASVWSLLQFFSAKASSLPIFDGRFERSHRSSSSLME